MTNLVEAAKREVVRRHAFFVSWFTGKGDARDMVEAARAFAPDFHMLWPDMALDDRDTLLAKLEQARGKSPANYAIEITFVHAMLVAPEVAVLVCDERQTIGETANSRRMSAVFSPAAEAPEGVQWRHLHQTWLPE